jgi:hypothetical protein
LPDFRQSEPETYSISLRPFSTDVNAAFLTLLSRLSLHAREAEGAIEKVFMVAVIAARTEGEPDLAPGSSRRAFA